jgi:hypothetical protein
MVDSVAVEMAIWLACPNERLDERDDDVDEGKGRVCAVNDGDRREARGGVRRTAE